MLTILILFASSFTTLILYFLIPNILAKPVYNTNIESSNVSSQNAGDIVAQIPKKISIDNYKRFSNNDLSFFYLENWTANENELVKDLVYQITFTENNDNVSYSITVRRIDDIPLDYLIESSAESLKEDFDKVYFSEAMESKFQKYNSIVRNFTLNELGFNFKGTVSVFNAEGKTFLTTKFWDSDDNTDLQRFSKIEESFLILEN